MFLVQMRPVLHVLGILLMILSATMAVPMALDLSQDNADWIIFFRSLLTCGFIGLSLFLATRQKLLSLTLKQTFFLTTSGWIVVAAFAALPFTFSHSAINYSHAFFEAMSGLTGTGSTAIRDLDNMPKGILLWRALLEFIGGVGFLAVSFSVLPLLQASGMQIFKRDAIDSDKILPSVSQSISYILIIYSLLVATCMALLTVVGMNAFDALCYAMSALATGGFSTSDAGLANFHDDAGVQGVLIIFMLLAALPFPLYLRLLQGNPRPLFQSEQVRAFLTTIVILIWIIALYLLLTGQASLKTSMLDTTFMVVSAITTTGLVTHDYAIWGHMVIGIIFLTAFIGGCSGSTAGGIKIFRFQIFFRMLHLQLKRLIKPSGIYRVEYNDKTVDPQIQIALACFFFIFMLSWLFLSIALQLSGHDFSTSFSGALAALSNTGTGGTNGIGSDISFYSMSNASIWIYTVAMLLGRLEFLGVFVLFMPRFWKV